MSSPIEKVPSVVRADTIDSEKGELILDRNADLGLQHLAKHGRVEYTPEEEAAVRWKIDLCLMPILAITFGLQYLDKVTISYAAVYGMRTDLHLVGTHYPWANSIFYFGSLVGEIPSDYLMQKLPIGKFASVNLFIWGLLVMLCALTKNFAGLAVMRFLMGVIVTAMFYKGQEQGTRCTVWYFMVGAAAIVGGLLSCGIWHVESVAVKQWQLVFLICGGFTVAWSLIVFLSLPDSPLNAKFLNERQRSIAIERPRSNPQEMGFSGLTMTLLTLPVGGTECSTSVATWGNCVCVWFLLCVPASCAILLSLISSNVGGFSKKITTTFLVFVFFCVDNIFSPRLFITSEAPHYGTGCRAMLVAICLCQALSIGLGCYYWLRTRGGMGC
ncbi:MFS general substrate transporter [Acephala macrosclerotiorum]|nr:MFS general substrate transporter [Acephala macrosclerotiorum]